EPPVAKYPHHAGLARRPAFVASQRYRRDHRYPIKGCGYLGEVDAELLVGERRLVERRLADDVMQLGRAAREQLVAIADQHVERAVAADAPGVRRDRAREIVDRARIRSELVIEGSEQRAERALAVGIADRPEPPELEAVGALDRAVVCEHELTAPQLAR